MGRIGRIIFISLSLLYLSFANEYKTYFPWESDTVFVAWVIKNYVDKNAKFKAVSKREKIEKNFSINTPFCDIKRNARFSAFEVSLHYYNIKNTICIKKLQRLIRVLEMTPWKKHEFNDIVIFEKKFVSFFPKKIGEANLSKVFNYLDEYCQKKGKK